MSVSDVFGFKQCVWSGLLSSRLKNISVGNNISLAHQLNLSAAKEPRALGCRPQSSEGRPQTDTAREGGWGVCVCARAEGQRSDGW